MQYDTITPLITRFNNLIDSLITDFKEYTADEETIIFLANKTKNFISFTELASETVIFKLLEKMNDEIVIIKQIIEKIFENMNASLNKILEHDHEEEHEHNHEHEHHIEIEKIQEDIEKIIENLEFLKKIFGTTCEMAITYLKYKNKDIDENEFNNEYDIFKQNINDYKNKFEEKLHDK